MELERTLVIIKPDGVERGLVGAIINRFEQRGLRIAGMKLMQVTDSLARRHYAVHEGKPFLDDRVEFMVSGPVVPMVLEKENAVSDLRTLVGATNPAQADCGSVRNEIGLDIQRNSVHASDSVENAKVEIGHFF